MIEPQQTETDMNEEVVAPLTISVPEAGKRYFGLSRNGSYGAAARGETPPSRLAGSCASPCAPWKRCSTAQVRRRSERDDLPPMRQVVARSKRKSEVALLKAKEADQKPNKIKRVM